MCFIWLEKYETYTLKILEQTRNYLSISSRPPLRKILNLYKNDNEKNKEISNTIHLA